MLTLFKVIEIWETYLMRLDAEDDLEDEDDQLGASASKPAPAVQPPEGGEGESSEGAIGGSVEE